MTVNNFEYKYKKWEDGSPYVEMYSEVIIKRNDKLWEVKIRTGFDITGFDKEFETCLESHNKHVRRTYYMWKVDEDKDPKDLINTIPYEHVDEQMTREEYTEKFGEDFY